MTNFSYAASKSECVRSNFVSYAYTLVSSTPNDAAKNVSYRVNQKKFYEGEK